MKWLLDHMTNYGADVKCCNKVGGALLLNYVYRYNVQKGSTALLIACEYQNVEMFKFLLDQVSEVTQQTEVYLSNMSLYDAVRYIIRTIRRVSYTLQLIIILMRLLRYCYLKDFLLIYKIR